MRYLAVIWGLGGVFLFIGSAVYRLSPYAIEALQSGLTTVQWAVAIVWTLFMLVSEGYRGFQKQFSPRVVARSKYLSANPKPLHVLFAPFFCMAYFHATKKRKIVTWSLTAGIVLLIVLVRQLEQPWRGIVDLGVVLGLVYGLSWILIYAVQCYTGGKFDVDPEVR